MLWLEIIYALLATWLALYGLNSLVLTIIYGWARSRGSQAIPRSCPLPSITVQLPIFNELHVAERLITAAAALDYPRDLLEIQVLDDSTDETAALARRAVAHYAKQGANIRYVHRAVRTGFKAGALAAGLRDATGEVLIVFDADFVPPRDFVRRIVPYFAFADVGCVQARWEHLNRHCSLLTQAQAIGIDGHFIVEQTARSRAGLFLNFNGSAGAWRRACIEDAGGWQADTLAEDLDLSYRAQLAGWRILFVPSITAPAELPPQFDALRRQQSRWAQGSIQVARKLLPSLLRSRQPLPVKIEGAIHLTGYLAHPLLLCTLLLTLPMVLTNSQVFAFTPYFLLATVGPPLLYLVAQAARGSDWWPQLRFAPFLVLLGTGLALSNTLAIARAFMGHRGEFERTPKFGVQSDERQWRQSTYALRGTPLAWYELLMAAFALVVAQLASSIGVHSISCWLLVYAMGYVYVAAMSLVQARRPLDKTVASVPKRGRQWRAGRHP
jgi:cellulose synthase/poly-beta-1,6-N-acetylglucosamine synthase-like glycosyltransferase